MPSGTPQPHERVLCFANQGDAPLGAVEGEIGKDDEISPPYFSDIRFSRPKNDYFCGWNYLFEITNEPHQDIYQQCIE